MIYNFGIYLYGFLISFASLWNEKAKKWRNGRKKWKGCLPEIPKDKEVIWFHCASMGEYDQGLPVMEKILEEEKSVFLLVTFFSPSGYEFLKNKSIAHYTSYLPLDTPANASYFISHFNPRRIFFVKYEFWLNYIDAGKKSNAEIYGLSTVFRPNHRFFKWYTGRFKKMIPKFNHFFVQDQASGDLLETHGYNHYTVSGDTRYDRVVSRAQQDHTNPILEDFSKQKDKLVVIGSSWPKDESILIPLINSEKLSSGIILAPHEVNKEHIDAIVSSLNVPFQKYTDLINGDSLKKETQVIILNCIGVLANAYRYGTIAYVGGAFGTGLHNILEPAAFGLPVIFGPDYKKFPEASIFIKEGIGYSVEDEASLASVAHELLENETIHNNVKAFINRQKGASDIVFKKIFN